MTLAYIALGAIVVLLVLLVRAIRRIARDSLYVTDVKVASELVAVQFSDGHTATFDPYTHGYGYQIEGLRRFSLMNGNDEVFRFDGRTRRQSGGNDQNVVSIMNLAYPQERAAKYWRVALDHVNRMERISPGGDNWYEWRTITIGGRYLLALMDGSARVAPDALVRKS